MARAIDLDKAIEIIEEKQKELCPVGRYGRNYVYGSDREKYDAWEEIIDALENLPTLTQPPITGDTSDGYHTFNELYHHRAVLFSVICNARPDITWKSKRHHDGTMYDDMFIVGIDTPDGQATYHYDIDPYWGLFRVKELEYAPEWDGHTPDEAIRRIGTLTPPNEPLTLKELREMDDEPVWCCPKNDSAKGSWMIVGPNGCENITSFAIYDDYGTGWLAYRRLPEGEANA